MARAATPILGFSVADGAVERFRRVVYVAGWSVDDLAGRSEADVEWAFNWRLLWAGDQA